MMSPPTVLVVEDEPLLRMTTMDMVEDAGFRVLEAANAAEAIRTLETARDIRIVLTDIDMPPGIDGLMMAGIIRVRWPPIEIILISGQTAPNAGDMPERSVFFAKPYIERDVVAALKTLVVN